MKMYIFVITTLIAATSANAQQPQYNFSDIGRRDQVKPPNAGDQQDQKTSTAADSTPTQPAAKQEKRTPETTLTYVRAGKSMTLEDTGGRSNYFGAVGHRRLADSFLFGAEYSYHFVSGTRFSDYDMLIGYRPQWASRVVPYGVLGGGLAFQYNVADDGKNHVTRSGINYFADLGTEFYTFDFGSFNMKMMSGLRLSTDVLAGAPNKMTFCDVYISVGFGW